MSWKGGSYSSYIILFVLGPIQWGDGPIDQLSYQIDLTPAAPSVNLITPYCFGTSPTICPLNTIGSLPISGLVTLRNLRDQTDNNVTFTASPKQNFDQMQAVFSKESSVPVTYDIYLNSSAGMEVLFTFWGAVEVPEYMITFQQTYGCNYFNPNNPPATQLVGSSLASFENTITGSTMYEMKTIPTDYLRSAHTVPQVQITKSSRLDSQSRIPDVLFQL